MTRNTLTNSGNPILNGSDRCSYYPLDGRKETHPAWIAANIVRFDPFQDAIPCWQVVMSAVPSPALGRLESVMDNGQIINCSRRDNRKQMR